MKEKVSYPAIAIILALAFLLAVPSPVSRMVKGMVRDAMAPYHALTAAARSAAGRRADHWRRRNALVDRLLTVEAELLEMRLRNSLLSGLRGDNEALRRQLNYLPQTPEELVPCRVIARGEMTGWWRTLRINRGAANRIEPDMAVVSEKGLVGRILTTSRNTAEVLLISDASSRVSVRVLPSGATGILEGAPPKLKRHDLPHVLLPMAMLGVDFLPLRGRIREGDRVVTSGLGGVFPRDIEVGVVVGVRDDPSGLYQHAEIMPSADLSRLDTLYVRRAFPGGERP